MFVQVMMTIQVILKLSLKAREAPAPFSLQTSLVKLCRQFSFLIQHLTIMAIMLQPQTG